MSGPNGETPGGLALSRALGDFCLKDFSLTSVPDVTQREISNRDKFVILATDGVWALQLVSSTADREKSTKRLVECAVGAWKQKKRGIATDDISTICLLTLGGPVVVQQ
jgi:serine/threonine protein phosphatase PrpC